MYDEEDYPQIKCGITKNYGEINLFIKYGPVNIAGEDDDIQTRAQKHEQYAKPCKSNKRKTTYQIKQQRVIVNLQ